MMKTMTPPRSAFKNHFATLLKGLMCLRVLCGNMRRKVSVVSAVATGQGLFIPLLQNTQHWEIMVSFSETSERFKQVG